MALRLVFFGTPDFAVPTLAAVAAGHEVLAVYTQPARAGGRRGLATTPSPVQAEAQRLGLVTRTPVSLRGAPEQEALAALGADAAVVVAYGLLLPPAVLETFPLGCWNAHASALPRWRGAAPIQRAIMAGDAASAVMVMRMEEGLDTGPVALSQEVSIGPEMTAGELHDLMMPVAASLMVEALARLEAGLLHTTRQPAAGATYARKIGKDEARIDWTRPAREVDARIRGLSPAPGAWSELTSGGRVERLKILRSTVSGSPVGETDPGSLDAATMCVACADGAVRLIEVQRPGGKAMPAQDYLRGLRDVAGAGFR